MSQERKTERLDLRLTPSDKQKASHNANLLGISMNEYIVRCIRLKRIVICENLPELIYHLGKIGTNINQIAAVANTNEYVSVNNVEEIKKLMKDCYGKFEDLLLFITEPENDGAQNGTGNIAETLLELTVAVRTMNKRLQKIEKHLDF